jgi:hypothetical protein
MFPSSLVELRCLAGLVDGADDQGIDGSPLLVEMARRHRPLRDEDVLALGTAQRIEGDQPGARVELDLEQPALRESDPRAWSPRPCRSPDL